MTAYTIPTTWRFNKHSLNGRLPGAWVTRNLGTGGNYVYNMRTEAVKLARTFRSDGLELPEWLMELIK